MDILPKANYILNTVLLRIQNQFFTEHEITILNFSGKKKQKNKQTNKNNVA